MGRRIAPVGSDTGSIMVDLIVAMAIVTIALGSIFALLGRTQQSASELRAALDAVRAEQNDLARRRFAVRDGER